MIMSEDDISGIQSPVKINNNSEKIELNKNMVVVTICRAARL